MGLLAPVKEELKHGADAPERSVASSSNHCKTGNRIVRYTVNCVRGYCKKNRNAQAENNTLVGSLMFEREGAARGASLSLRDGAHGTRDEDGDMGGKGHGTRGGLREHGAVPGWKERGRNAII
jgi:hypothetical protein